MRRAERVNLTLLEGGAGGIDIDARPIRLDGFSALVLNADFRPTSFLPLPLMPWQEAVKGAISGDVIVVKEYPYPLSARSQSIEVPLPSVVALKHFAPRRDTPALTKRNLLELRDRCSCAYCGLVFAPADLEFEHVIPRSQGGRDCWDNLVAACRTCNQRKANRTPEQARMPLLWRPWTPTEMDLARTAMLVSRLKLHEHWLEFLPFAQAA